MVSSPAGRKRQGPLARVLTKIGVSAFFGALALGLSLTLDGSAEAHTLLAIGTSVFVSGIAFVVQFLVDVETRVDQLTDSMAKVGDKYEEHSRASEETIRLQFEKINAATELFGAVEASALRIDATTQLVRDATAAVRSSSALVSKFAQGEIGRLAGYLEALGQGADVPYDGEDRDWLLGLTKAATVSIDATSLTTVDAGGRGFMDGGLWNSDLGHKYLQEQHAAVKRGVKIRRIFIFDRPEFQHDKDLLNILRRHVAIGVEVRTLAPGLDRYSFIDFIVLDGELVYQSQPESRLGDSRPIIATTTLVTKPERVFRRLQQYHELWESATEFIPPPAIPSMRESVGESVREES